MEANVTIYTTGYCGFCTRAKSLLGQKGVRYTEVDVESREELRDWLRKASGQRTVPQVFINGKSVGGYSDIAALEKEGKLDGLLSQAPPADAPAMPR
ncbi:glutaredoxin 3 [Chondromyces apiculatus]|uniref:Glutaredoxin n=1 Tax=Chondromyces apiculatus DSM 436 TaxID=1192034 RepID=A0A017TBL6_9BACT|nr:glutaredoxin 3 [Chondromyces apiculatus]EYF06317.1 Glutaredoxin, GrxC [Chondromyces apiculatus DSM 436]